MVTDGYILLEYIKQLMAEKGHKHYHWEPVAVIVENPTYKFQVQGEYYIFVCALTRQKFIIKSDVTFIEVDPGGVNVQIVQYREFTGLIEITQAAKAKTIYEFIRVIPEQQDIKKEAK